MASPTRGVVCFITCASVLVAGCSDGSKGGVDGTQMSATGGAAPSVPTNNMATGGTPNNMGTGGTQTGGMTSMQTGGMTNMQTGGMTNMQTGGTPNNPATGGAPAEPPPGSYKVCTPGPKVEISSPMMSAEGDGKRDVGQMGYFDQPELVDNPQLPQGRMVEFTMQSTESAYYKGLQGPFSRRVRVFVPSQYKPGTEAPFIVTQDGYTFDLPPVLNNLIPGKCLPVMIGIFVDNGGGDAPGSNRGLEYDTVSGTYGDFLFNEVFPRVEQEAGVVLTKDPEGGASVGTSTGAAAAFTLAWFHPNRIRRVISYSGTFVNLQSAQDAQSTAAVQMYPHGAWEYHERLIAESDLKPLRVWLLRGEYDQVLGNRGGVPLDWQVANDNMFTELNKKGYHVSYSVALGSGHSDGAAHGLTFPEAMMWAWRGYPIE